MSEGAVLSSDIQGLDCLRLMDQTTIFHLLVVDEEQTLLGMLSISGILRVVVPKQKARADLMESFTFPTTETSLGRSRKSGGAPQYL